MFDDNTERDKLNRFGGNCEKKQSCKSDGSYFRRLRRRTRRKSFGKFCCLQSLHVRWSIMTMIRVFGITSRIGIILQVHTYTTDNIYSAYRPKLLHSKETDFNERFNKRITYTRILQLYIIYNIYYITLYRWSERIIAYNRKYNIYSVIRTNRAHSIFFLSSIMLLFKI